MPWVNVSSTGDYGRVLSQAGSGDRWRTHASRNRLTRWDQEVIRDECGISVCVRDAESGVFWPLGHQPTGDVLRNDRVRHGLG